MRLELKVSNRMTYNGENSSVRLPENQKSRLRVQTGNTICLRAKDNTKIPVIVADIYVEDYDNDTTVAYVSQNIFNAISGLILEHQPVSLGCDPEFVLVNQQRKIVPANLWLPHLGEIGSDGPLAELRPSPAHHELDVIEHLRVLIKRLPNILDKNLSSGALLIPEAHSCIDNYALGFHIHLGVPPEILTFAAPKTGVFFRSLITALDYFVGIPALLLEDTNTRRLGSGVYGKPGDYRISNKTIEYRTPGGFHLRHPEYAAGILGLALCVTEEIIEETNRSSLNWKNLDQVAGFQHIRDRFNLPEKKDIRWALQEPTKREAIGHTPNLIKQIKMLKRYNEHEYTIGKYFRLVGQHKQFNASLFDNW